KVLEVIAVELEAEGFSLLDNPVQGLIGKAIRCITTSNVAVNAWEPGLFELASPTQRTSPKVGFERLTALVNSERLIGVMDMWVRLDVVILVFALVDNLAEKPRCTKGTNGIPHADESDGRTGACTFHVVKGLVPFGRARSFAAFVTGIDLRDVIVIVLLNQADFVHEAGKGADGECPAAESEKVKVVAELVVVHDKAVQVANVSFDAFAESATRESVEATSSAYSIMIVHDLVDLAGCPGKNCAGHFGDV